MSQIYEMSVSMAIIDKLGVHLYDKASAVMAELVSNAYDADATKVTIEIPLGERLGWKINGKIVSSEFKIEVRDDGHGMVPKDINRLYLKIGRNRREDKGTKSPKFKRQVTGRKGIGKLAPFGICKRIEIISSGGRKTKGKYKVAHFILDYDKIQDATDSKYHPEIGPLDGTFKDERGTKVIVSDFMNQTVPDADTVRRMLARRFGLSQRNFSIYTIDTSQDGDGKPHELTPLDIPIREETKIDLKDYEPFEFEEVIYPIRGWVAYSTHSYRDEARTGIRVLVHDKMAASVRDFNIRSGFTGEYNMRSYLVGVMHCDWLDSNDGDDLIQTHRHDLMWGSDLGKAFEEWGQKLLRKLARDSSDQVKESRAKSFIEKAKLKDRIESAFSDKAIRKSALDFGKALGRMADGDALEDEIYVEDLADLTISLAPHKTLLDKLREAEKLGDAATLEVLAEIFRVIRVADGYSLGQIAKYKVQIIDVLENHINKQDPPPNEKVLQSLIERSPWLVYPTWHLVSADKSFNNFRRNFEGWYRKNYKEDLVTSTFEAKEGIRPDFIFVHSSEGILLLEIKKPGYQFQRSDLERLTNYVDALDNFFEENPELKKQYPRYQAVLVCDKIRLPRVERGAISDLESKGKLKRRTWIEVLSETQAVYRDFISAWRAQEGLHERGE
ncbi:MAG: ATP-binding protein [Candidatus Thorarchaeota archaeon]|nr:MAG: ATP-binding protein [Candidatus Thorarchaeota archaeon]